MTQNRRGGDKSIEGGIIIETEHDRMEQALKTWRLMNSCRDRSDGNSSRSSIPDSFRVLPSLASSSLLLRRIRILIIHTSLPLHFISYCCHCTLSLSLLHCHLQLRPLFTCTACCCCRWCSRLRTTPGQPREFYAHTMKRFSHLSFHRPGPFRPSVSPQAESRWLRKDNEFPGKMFGLIGYGPGSGAGYIEWFGLLWFALLYAMCSFACVSRNVISLVAITRICVRSPDCRLNELCPPFLHFSFWAEKISSFLQL